MNKTDMFGNHYYDWQKPKPPIGLKPKDVHDCERKKEIINAMNRYSDENKSIPAHWIDELYTLRGVK